MSHIHIYTYVYVYIYVTSTLGYIYTCGLVSLILQLLCRHKLIYVRAHCMKLIYYKIIIFFFLLCFNGKKISKFIAIWNLRYFV